MAYLDAFHGNPELITKLGESNAHLVWAIAMLIQETDVQAFASAALTDGSGDKKIDLLHVDRGEGRLILAQGYFAINSRDSAPANKASDLNTAVAWLFSGDVSGVPDTLREAIFEAREALREGEITSINIFYVHNLPESINVSRELQTVAEHTRKALPPQPAIAVIAKELGSSAIEHLFASQESHIEVTEEVICPCDMLISQTGPGWEATVLSVPGVWLHGLYAKYGDSLFSANYRGFLGIGKRRKINNAIRATAEESPADFWAYNNGVTILTLGFGKLKGGTRITGISIINGAQTTGSIGNVELSKYGIPELRVLCRVIRCSDKDKISKIVQFNNTQNEITTWDQYSSDPEQVRIESEFVELGYHYERKRGFRLQPDVIGIEDVSQPLAAFQGRFSDANRGKNRIFERPQVYKQVFDGKKARHILLVYSLARAIDERRFQLKAKSSISPLIKLEQQQLLLLRNLRFKYFLLSVVAHVLEPILGFPVDLATVAYSPVAAQSVNRSLVTHVAAALPVVSTVLGLLCATVTPDNLSDFLTDEAKTDQLCGTISAMMLVSGAREQCKFWAENVVPG